MDRRYKHYKLKFRFPKRLKAIQKPKSLIETERKLKEKKKNTDEQVVFGNWLWSEVCGPCEQVPPKASAELLPDKDWISCLLCITLHLAHITSFPFWDLPPDSSYKVKHKGELHWVLVVLSGFLQLCPGINFSKPQFPQL